MAINLISKINMQLKVLRNFKICFFQTKPNHLITGNATRWHCSLLFWCCCWLSLLSTISRIDCASLSGFYLKTLETEQKLPLPPQTITARISNVSVYKTIQTTFIKSRKLSKRDIEQEMYGRIGNEMPTTSPPVADTCQQDSDCLPEVIPTTTTATLTTTTSSATSATNSSTLQHQTAKCIKSKCQNQNLTANQEIENKSRPKASKPNLRMLPIMLIMGVMFVGMCVALNMFSRARFGNKRRSIFSNPHILQHKSKSSRSRRVKDSAEYRQQQLLRKQARMQAKLNRMERGSNVGMENSIECIEQTAMMMMMMANHSGQMRLPNGAEQSMHDTEAITEDGIVLEPGCSNNTAN